MNRKQNYVAGFLFSKYRTQVALVQKNKPDFMKGKWNAIGGKIEKDETPLQSQIREFEEETGVYIQEWNYFLTLTDENNWKVYFFKAFSSDKLFKVKTMEEEIIEIHDVKSILFNENFPMMINLRWIISMALTDNNFYNVIEHN